MDYWDGAGVDSGAALMDIPRANPFLIREIHERETDNKHTGSGNEGAQFTRKNKNFVSI